ncbi:epoxyqueuosine reductase QueH [Bacillus sp. 1P06AnD]|uniref:epoxyqueuosine reductase QueH n=1 Tax=Bacillus sp. 1P06AnD TaxID=3132208 RepID=UPI00399FFE56
MFIHSVEILEKMDPNQKINYDRVMKKMIQSWEMKGLRPQILIHSCCAPCSTYTLEFLAEYADITIYFANSNIHPRKEYERRKAVQQQFVEAFNRQTNHNVQFLGGSYEPRHFFCQTKGLETEPEGGKRCSVCFQMRLDQTALKAKELGFDYFGSALTLSPKKNASVINELGMTVQEIFDVRYLPSDFKKNNGYQRSIEMCKEYNVYRQCYCGCIFAAQQQGVDMAAVNAEAKAYAEEFTLKQ